MEGAYISQTQAYFKNITKKENITTKKKSNPANIYFRELWNSKNSREKSRETRHKETFNSLNSDIGSERSLRHSKNFSKDMKSAQKYSCGEKINSNFINNIDLRYNSKAAWHKQGSLSHDILISEDPKKIQSKYISFT